MCRARSDSALSARASAACRLELCAARTCSASSTRRDALADVKRILEDGKMRVKAELAGAPSEFQAWQLPKIQQSIDRALGDVGEVLAESGAAAAS